MVRSGLAAILLLLAAPVCAGQAPLRSATVVADFGGAVDDPAEEMLQVTDVVRAADGTFVVANGEPLEVRRYDATGRLLTRLGRAGAGPGEFRYYAALEPWPGDSVLTYSAGSRRWMLFSLDGALVREWPQESGGAAPDAVAIVGGAFVRHEVGRDANCVATTIRRLAPASDSLLREVMVDDAHRIWVRPAGGLTWEVFTAEGRPLARVPVPARFAISQLERGDMVGTRLDVDDFPHVTVVRPDLGVAAPAPACTASELEQPDRAGDLKTVMRNLMTAQEAFYSRQRRYAVSTDELGAMFSLPEGVAARVLTADERNFAVMAWDRVRPGRCVVSVGAGVPGLPSGRLACGR